MERLPSDSALPRRTSGRAELSPRSDSAADNLPAGTLATLRLRALPVDEALALLAGVGAPGVGLRWHQDYPMPETLGALTMVVEAHRAVGSLGAEVPAWWLHQIVVDGLVVGDVGFHGPPAGTTASVDGPEQVLEVEVGYNVVEGVRGRGVATRACQLVVGQAWRDGASVVRAETEADNLASQRVLLRAGFRDEGGLHFVITRPETVGD